MAQFKSAQEFHDINLALQSRCERAEKERDELNEKLREVAKIAFGPGGGKGRYSGKLWKIKQLVWDWKEK